MNPASSYPPQHSLCPTPIVSLDWSGWGLSVFANPWVWHGRVRRPLALAEQIAFFKDGALKRLGRCGPIFRWSSASVWDGNICPFVIHRSCWIFALYGSWMGGHHLTNVSLVWFALFSGWLGSYLCGRESVRWRGGRVFCLRFIPFMSRLWPGFPSARGLLAGVFVLRSGAMLCALRARPSCSLVVF